MYRAIDFNIQKMKYGLLRSLFVEGRGGIGKSYNIRKSLERHGFIEITDENKHIFDMADKETKEKYYKVIAGAGVSDAYLYRLLYEYNYAIIWFKDVGRMLNSQKTIDHLNTATETDGKRIITNYNYSSKQIDLPEYFEFGGKIIFDYNAVNKKNKLSFEALISRGEHIHLVMSNEQIFSVMQRIAKNNDEKEVTSYIIKNFKNKVNLRVQQRAFNTYRLCKKLKIDWKMELKREIESMRTPKQKMIYELIGNSKIRRTELRKLMCRRLDMTKRRADRFLENMLDTGELRKIGTNERNYEVCL